MKVLTYFLILMCLTTFCRGEDIRPVVHGLQLMDAAEVRAKGCQLPEASALYREAQQVLQSANDDSEPDAVGIGALLAVADTQLKEIAVRKSLIATERQKVEALLLVGRADSAKEAWESYGGPTCDPAMGTKIKLAKDSSFEAEQKADVEVNPRRRLALYEAAYKLNGQKQGLYAKLSTSRQIVDKMPCDGCRTARKVIKRIVIVGAIVAAGYFGYQEYRNRWAPSAQH